MFRKIISSALAFIMVLSILSFTALAGTASVTASPTASKVLVNGKETSYDAYNIGGNNFFMLRDLAYTLSGSAKQFEVGWDAANNAISLTSGKPYTPVGGEMAGKGAGNKSGTPTSSKIYLDGKLVQFTAYNIGGNNYFKLRDIGQAFDFGVDWDGAKNTIAIDTSKGYTPEETSGGTGSGTGSGTGTPATGSSPEIKTGYSASELASIRTGAEALIQEFPTGGKEITRDELWDMLDMYYTSTGDGNTYYYKSMNGQFIKSGGKWISDNWLIISADWYYHEGSSSVSRGESLIVADYSPDFIGKIECQIYKSDDQFYYTWSWDKGASEGDYYKSPRSGGTSGGGYNDPDTKVMLYPEAKVNGQDCIVYSITYYYDTTNDYEESESTTYYWFSKTKGFDILSESPSPDYQALFAGYTYEDISVNTNADFYDTTKQGVTVWHEYSD